VRPSICKPAYAAAAIVTLLVLSQGQALASHVACGDTITQDTRLDSDLVNCPGDGIVIGSDNVTLDLNGHTIDGVRGSGGDGVDNSAGHVGVTVERGTILDFLVGVRMEGASENLVTGLTFHVGSGAYLIDSDRNEISRNSLIDSDMSVHDRSDANLIRQNDIAGGEILIASRSSAGPFPTANLVERNNVHGGPFGLFVAQAIDTRIERNNFFDNAGVAVEITITGNGTQVLDNSVSDSGLGILVTQSGGVSVVRNQVSQNGGDGIMVSSAATDTRVERNSANGNGDDGIDVDSPRTTITRNASNNNFDFGIDAVGGVTDGGGNRASGNGNPAQCMNVVCR
jgi:parallel beta-helix repeat protein